MHKKTSSLLLALTTLFATAPSTRADDWPQWRGPGHNDVVAEPSGWNGGDWLPEKEQWTRLVGAGCTSPIVVGDRLIAMGWRNGSDNIYCLDANTGKTLWQQSYACPQYGRQSTGDKGIYSGPTSTPSFDAASELLITLSTDGDLRCWNTAQQGAAVWDLNLYEQYDPPRRPKVGRSGQRDYGYTSAPLVYGDWVLVEVGSTRDGNLMAFDKHTGSRVWASQSKDHAGHTGGVVPMTVAGVPAVAVLTFSNLLVVRLDQGREGETLAEYPWVTEFANSIATPAVQGNQVLITSAYNHYKMCKLTITMRGAKKEWEVEYPSKVCSPIVHDGHVYWAWRKLHCLDFATGKVRWIGKEDLGDPGSCLLTADDRLIVWSKRGKLLLTETAGRSPDRCQVLAQRDGIFRSDAWPHVVLAGGRLFCKDRQGYLKCFQLR